MENNVKSIAIILLLTPNCFALDWDLFGCRDAIPPLARQAPSEKATVTLAPPTAAPVSGRRYLPLTAEQKSRGVISCYVDDTPQPTYQQPIPPTIYQAAYVQPMLPAAPSYFGSTAFAGSFGGGCSTCGPGGCR